MKIFRRKKEKEMSEISTENLYLGKLLRYSYSSTPGKSLITRTVEPLVPNRYVLVRRNGICHFKDVFTGTDYNPEFEGLYSGEITVELVNAIISNSGKITYKDAVDILETKNTVIIKR